MASNPLDEMNPHRAQREDEQPGGGVEVVVRGSQDVTVLKFVSGAWVVGVMCKCFANCASAAIYRVCAGPGSIVRADEINPVRLWIFKFRKMPVSNSNSSCLLGRLSSPNLLRIELQ